jgi:tyrosinase
MHFTSLIAATSLAFTTVAFASPYKPASDNDAAPESPSAWLAKRQNGPVITTGATGLGDGKIHSRLEINDVYFNRPEQWSLLVRAMTQWKSLPEDLVTGYFQISSIHGRPAEDFDGVSQCADCAGADGYCTHDSVLFPCWHRAYTALYEQEFIKIAIQIASTFQGDFGARMQAAAATIRTPYWDWAARPDPNVPVAGPMFTDPQVTIIGPNGDETVDNPLYTAHFNDPSALYYGPFTTWPNVMRWPNSNDADGHSQEDQCVNALNGIQQNMQDQVYQMITQCNDYQGLAIGGSCPNSIEAVHNTIHTTVGGSGFSASANQPAVSGGHMTFLPLASFDPMFWVHHCNIDRIFALWQTVHPDSYGATQQATHATWTIAQGETVDANYGMKPFRKSATDFLTCNDVRDWADTFHYTYPEFVITDGSAGQIGQVINDLYGPNPNETASSISTRVEHGSGPVARALAPASPPPNSGSQATPPQNHLQSGDTPSDANDEEDDDTNSGGLGIDIPILGISLGLGWGSSGSKTGSSSSATTSVPYPTATRSWGSNGTANYPRPTGTASASAPPNINPAFIAPNGSVYQYQLNIETPRYYFNNSYRVYVFDGQPSSNDTETWYSDPNLCGVMGVLAGGMNHEQTTQGSVPVTRRLQQLVQNGQLPDMTEETVIPYMKENLNWKIASLSDEVHPNDVPGFKSAFITGLLSSSNEGGLPSWSGLKPVLEVTQGKAGGITELAQAMGGVFNQAVGAIEDTVGNAVGGIMGGMSGSGPAGAGAAPSSSCSTSTQHPAPTGNSPPPAYSAPPSHPDSPVAPGYGPPSHPDSPVAPGYGPPSGAPAPPPAYSAPPSHPDSPVAPGYGPSSVAPAPPAAYAPPSQPDSPVAPGYGAPAPPATTPPPSPASPANAPPPPYEEDVTITVTTVHYVTADCTCPTNAPALPQPPISTSPAGPPAPAGY